MDTFSIDCHSRAIIHIDIDCFYAQVEMIKNPHLKDVPLGIQQKNIVVTCNYIARECGVKKCISVTEAKKLCPNLVLVNGEDLHGYRQTSYEVTKMIQSYSEIVERLGLDENYVDVTSLVKERLEKCSDVNVSGNIFGDITEMCDCGCTARLKMGTVIAKEIRDKLHTELGLTTCAGISSNKLLAKLAGTKHKPNQQTVVFPNSALELMLSLGSVNNITGIGAVCAEQLSSIGIQKVSELQSVDLGKLQKLLGKEKATYVQSLSLGVDNTPVKVSGKPLSIGIEDSCKSLSAESEVTNKLRQLLHRLLVLIAEDGRIPKTLKLTVRKYDKNTRLGSRETRQCNITPGLFNRKNLSQLSEHSENKIMELIMLLFKKVINIKKPYSLTLLGLSFTKFIEVSSTRNSLTKFLKQDIEVQSITNIENKTELSNNNNPSELSNNNNPSPISFPSTSSISLESSDTEQPSPKKGKLSLFLIKQSYINVPDECESPSKLKVDEMHLNSEKNSPDLDQKKISCPPNANEEVFRELPSYLQLELWEEYQSSRERDKIAVPAKKSRPNSIMNYLVKKT